MHRELITANDIVHKHKNWTRSLLIFNMVFMQLWLFLNIIRNVCECDEGTITLKVKENIVDFMCFSLLLVRILVKLVVCSF